MKSKNLLFAASLAFSIVATPASSAVVTYSNHSQFISALGSYTNYGFGGIAAEDGFVYYPSTDQLTIENEFTFKTSDEAYVIGQLSSYGGYGLPFYRVQASQAPIDLTVTFNDLYVIGFNYGTGYANTGWVFDITPGSGEPITISMPTTANASGFIGFISDVAFDSVTFNQTNGYVFDVLSFVVGSSQSHQVPEPAGMALVGVGLAALYLLRRQRSI